MNYLQTLFYRKVPSVKVKKWSAPAIMSQFLIICMVFIYSCEALGLTSKDKMVQNYKHRNIIVNAEDSSVKIGFGSEWGVNGNKQRLEYVIQMKLQELNYKEKHGMIFRMKMILGNSIYQKEKNGNSNGNDCLEFYQDI